METYAGNSRWSKLKAEVSDKHIISGGQSYGTALMDPELWGHIVGSFGDNSQENKVRSKQRSWRRCVVSKPPGRLEAQSSTAPVERTGKMGTFFKRLFIRCICMLACTCGNQTSEVSCRS